MALNSIFKSLFVLIRLGSWIKAQVLAASGKHASELIGNGCQFLCLDRQCLCFAFNDHSFLPNLWFHEGNFCFYEQEAYFYIKHFYTFTVKTAAWLAQLVERQSTVREVEGSSPRPDQH